MLGLVGNINNVVAAYYELEWPEDDIEVVFDEFFDIGENVGKIGRAFLGLGKK